MNGFDWGHSSVVGELERCGFETAIKLGGSLPRYLRGDALDVSGLTLGSTAVLDSATGEAVLVAGE